MIPDYDIKQLLVPTTAITAASTANWGHIDTKGYDYLSISLNEMSASAATQVTGLRVREGDTAPTAFTDLTAIVALTGAAATSTSAGFALPYPNSAAASGNNYKVNIDLRGRKRYIGLDYIPSVTTRASAVALLFRGEEGASIATSTDKTATTTTESLRLSLHV